MEHINLLYYQDVSAMEAEQGSGGTVTTVRPGVAFEHETKTILFNKKKTTYSVTVNYKRINGDVIASSSTVESGLVLEGREAKVKLTAEDIENYVPVRKEMKIIISGDSSYDFMYKMYTSHTVTFKHEFSGETIMEDTVITTDPVPETDFIRVSFTPETIPGYKYEGNDPIVLQVSSDTVYTIEYVESAGVNFGDVVYYDGSALATVAWTDWDESLGQPVGIITIPSNVAPDGNARMLLPSNLDSSAPVPVYAMAQYPVDSKYSATQAYYTNIPVWNNDSGAPSYNYTSGKNYCDIPSDYFSNYPCAGNGAYGYGQYGNEDYLIPPMINPDGTLNEHCMTALTGGNALSDWNGLGNTVSVTGTNIWANRIQTIGGESGDFALPGTNPGDWYLPSLAELCYTMSNWQQIVDIVLSIVGGESEQPDNYMSFGGYTSTYSDSGDCFSVGADGGYICLAEEPQIDA